MTHEQLETAVGLQSNHNSLEVSSIDPSGGSQSSISGVITPRGRRDPSPAELGLLKARSIEPQVLVHHIAIIESWVTRKYRCQLSAQ